MPRLLRDRYQTLGVVGAGSQGEVQCARDVVHDRLVAIKVRRTSSAADRTELLAEARTLLDVRPHPGISLAREDFFAAGRYHLVMDWVQGIDLSRWLTEGSPAIPSYADVVRVLGQVADALDHLHGHQPPVVHKDVKPSNILIDRDGRAVLVDFGLTGRRGARHRRSGTMGYRAPEVAAGERFGAAADIFSLAATAYFAFTGRPPEPGGTPLWRSVPPALVPRVEAALARGLALDPARRPPSARAFVELLSPPAVPHNLPAPLTRFVGRESDLSAMARALDGARLLTLTGIGGVGKTRLSVQLAAQEAWAYPGGVWFVELGPLGDGQFVVPAIAKSLGIPEAPGRSPLETVGDRLRNRRVLLVLDNCEHLLDAAAETAEGLLKAAPELRIVATSRQPLDIFGEVIYRVPPLPAPQPDEGLTAEDVAAFESVVLFCDRAAVAVPSFALKPANARCVAAICHRLDGLPLALEMAAARLRDLDIADLAASLATSVELTGARTAPARQRTLAATVAWSYDLLSGPEATLFRRLSIFAGGFTHEGAASVCADGDVPASQIAQLLDDLVQCSMVVRHERDDRYGLLETLRRFGEERLALEEDREHFADQHLTWFLSVVEDQRELLFGPTESRALEILDQDLDNFRLALRRAIDERQLEVSFRLTRALSRFWNVRAHWSEGRRWLEQALERAPEAPAALRAPAMTAAAVMAENQGDFPVATYLAKGGLQLAREANDGATAAEALNSLSNVAQAQGDRETSNRLLDECLAWWRSSGKVRGTVSSFAGALGAVGWRAAWRGELADARRLFDEAMVIADQLQIRRARVNCLMGLATVAEAEGALEEAQNHVDEARSISRELGDKRFLGMQFLLDGLIALGEGDEKEAISQLSTALKEAVSAGDQVLFLRSLEGMARVAAARDEPARAVTLFGTASALRDTLPWPISPSDRRWHEPLLARLRADLDAAAAEDSWARGRSMSLEEAEAFAQTEAPPMPASA